MHAKTTHEETQYTCKQCDYKVRTKDELKKHIGTVHERKPESCDQRKI